MRGEGERGERARREWDTVRGLRRDRSKRCCGEIAAERKAARMDDALGSPRAGRGENPVIPIQKKQQGGAADTSTPCYHCFATAATTARITLALMNTRSSRPAWSTFLVRLLTHATWGACAECRPRWRRKSAVKDRNATLVVPVTEDSPSCSYCC